MNEAAENMNFEDTTSDKAPKQPAISDEIRQAFDSAISAGKVEDMIKIDLIAAGAKFKQATRIYNELMVEAGLAISKEDKDAAVASACIDADLGTEEGFNAAVAELDAAIESTNAKGAAVMVRAYARKNERECFKKPKSGSGVARVSFVYTYCNYVRDNPDITKGDIDTFIKEKGNKMSIKFMSRWYAIAEMAQQIRAHA